MHGPAEQIALQQIAPGRAQAGELLRRLHSLGDDGEAEPVDQLGHGLDHDQALAGLVFDPLDEGPVDLDVIHRQEVEGAQRGVARAEIVEGNGDPRVFSTVSICARDSSHRRIMVVSVISMVKAVAIEPHLAEYRSQAVGEIRLRELHGGNVDVDVKLREYPAACQAAIWRQAPVMTQLPMGTMRPVSSAIGMKSRRVHGSELRMLETNQGLEPEETLASARLTGW